MAGGKDGFSLSQLRDWRIAYGITREDLAKEAGVPVESVAKAERGEEGQNTQTLRVIVEALNSATGQVPLADRGRIEFFGSGGAKRKVRVSGDGPIAGGDYHVRPQPRKPRPPVGGGR